MPRFAYTLRTIGANEVKLQEESSYWSFWKVQFNTPIGSDYGYYLYLKANCPFLEGNSTNIKRWRELSEPKKYQIVVTPRSKWNSDLEAVRKKFKGELAISSQTLIRQALMQNVKFRDIDTTDPFIEPNVASLLVPEKGVNSLQMLKDWISREDAKSILVLVGDGGMGKTTLVRQLANDLQRGPNRIYPILIESDQWRYALHSRLDLADIWDLAIRRSLDHSFSHNFIYHEDAFHTLVSEGLFVIIFDGFDELCLNPQFPGGPSEIINQLMSYIHSDDDDKPARILLTSRETYWYSTTENMEYEKDLEIYKLLGFNNQQRRNYFRTYFGDKEDSEERIDTALRVSKEVGGKLFRNTENEDVNAERLSGTPLILHLIAVALESGTTIDPYETDPLDRILLGVCMREKRRQQLSIDENTQMEIFEELFRNDAHGIQEDDIQLCLDIYGGADALQDESQMARFRHHFFLVRDQNGACIPRYEVLRTYFISRFLARGLLESKQSAGARRTFIEHLAKNANVAGTTQITDWLVIQLRQHREDILVDAFRKASEMLHEPISRSQTIVSQQRFAGQMLFKIVLQLLPSNIDKESKRVCLARYFSSNSEANHMSEVHFCDILEGFDFCGCKFSNSSFESVVFRNCTFDADTVFERSVFFGVLTFQNSTGQKMIVVDETCTMSDEADLTVNQLRGRKQEKSRAKKLAENAIVQALDQLRSRRGHGYIALKIDYIAVDKSNPYSRVDNVWKELEAAGVVYRGIVNASDGRGDGYRVSDDSDVREELRSFRDNRIFGKRLSQIMHKLSE